MSWPTARLGDLVDNVRSGFASGQNIPDGILQFRMNNVTSSGAIDLTKKRRVPIPRPGIGAFLLEPGDVLFNATNSPELVGKSAFFPGLDEPVTFSNHFYRLRPCGVDGRYLAHWLTYQFMTGAFHAITRRWVNQAAIDKDALLKCKIPIPAVAEQRHIADVLDQADALRSQRRQALARLNDLIGAVFIDMFGDPVTNPRGWPNPTLGRLLTFQQYGPRFYNEAYSAEGVRIIRITDLNEAGELDFSAMPKLTVTADELKKYALQAGDLIFARTGATVGKVALIHSGDPACIAGAYFITMRFDISVEAVYARALLTSTSIRAVVAKQSRQAAQQNFSGPALRRLPMPVPPIDLQHSFVQIADKVDKLRDEHRSSLVQLNALFTSLQNRAFQGNL
jgi:type I restriction enzyme, S subunit